VAETLNLNIYVISLWPEIKRLSHLDLLLFFRSYKFVIFPKYKFFLNLFLALSFYFLLKFLFTYSFMFIFFKPFRNLYFLHYFFITGHFF